MSSGHRVWIVDDEPGLAQTMCELLRRPRLQTRAFADPARLLEAARTGPAPDVVVTDYRMPLLDGGALAEELYRIYQDAPKVICVTGYRPEIRRGAHGRFYGVVEKPFSIDELALVVDQALGRRGSSLRMRAVQRESKRAKPG